eukprot:4187750-Pyramimonas_sp.AAC.1
MKEIGKCSADLWALLLALRSVLHGEAQEVEGWNHVLQIMAKRAPGMGPALANARLHAKHGHQLGPDECSSLHDQAPNAMKSGKFDGRFAPHSNQLEHQLVPAPPGGEAAEPCGRRGNRQLRKSAALAIAVFKT